MFEQCTRLGRLSLPLAIGLFLGCGDNAGAKETADADVGVEDGGPRIQPRLRAAACKYPINNQTLSEGADFECGDLLVPEDRGTGRGEVALHFIRYFSDSDTGRGTIYLDGGPGGSGANMVSRVDSFGAGFLEGLLVDGDFIVISQRGTNMSEPSLDCGMQSCSLLWDEHNMAAYNTAYNADDVNDLREALGYSQLNLYGISYGSRLGFEILRRHGERIRSAILGGVVPSHVVWPAAVPSSFWSAFQALQSSCQEQQSCAAFGNLHQKFLQGFESLNTEPLVFSYQGEEISVSGWALSSLVFRLLYAKSAHAYIPMLISDLAERRIDRVQSLIGSILSGGPSGVAYGMYYSVVCSELVNPPSQNAFAEYNSEVPEEFQQIFGSWFSLQDTCSEWPKGDWQAALAAPVESSVPTLLTSGRLDPITPPGFGELAEEHLSKAQHIVYENSGHGASLQSSCGIGHVAAFLADPSADIDASCASAITTEYMGGQNFFVGISSQRIARIQKELEMNAMPVLQELGEKQSGR